MLRMLPIDSTALGLVSAGQPEPVFPWIERDGRRQPSTEQERDEATGQPVWTVFVLPTQTERPEVISVRVPAPQQPVLTQFGPVTVEGLQANVRVDKAGKLAQYWSAAGARDGGPQHGHRGKPQEHKPEGQG